MGISVDVGVRHGGVVDSGMKLLKLHVKGELELLQATQHDIRQAGASSDRAGAGVYKLSDPHSLHPFLFLSSRLLGFAHLIEYEEFPNDQSRRRKQSGHKNKHLVYIILWLYS